eukprot:TRINITY_DN3758_c0_g1_i2.p1 TRINITY_DN3758_c0_g1~~TRINITY_DN3758_c0_g1_i2.p1  ORF type:complete len:565 (+),score=95.41 TRINITY_DN3758_c0_g1_i2:82-1776(+)
MATSFDWTIVCDGRATRVHQNEVLKHTDYFLQDFKQNVTRVTVVPHLPGGFASLDYILKRIYHRYDEWDVPEADIPAVLKTLQELRMHALHSELTNVAMLNNPVASLRKMVEQGEHSFSVDIVAPVVRQFDKMLEDITVAQQLAGAVCSNLKQHDGTSDLSVAIDSAVQISLILSNVIKYPNLAFQTGSLVAASRYPIQLGSDHAESASAATRASTPSNQPLTVEELLSKNALPPAPTRPRSQFGPSNALLLNLTAPAVARSGSQWQDTEPVPPPASGTNSMTDAELSQQLLMQYQTQRAAPSSTIMSNAMSVAAGLYSESSGSTAQSPRGISQQQPPPSSPQHHSMLTWQQQQQQASKNVGSPLFRQQSQQATVTIPSLTHLMRHLPAHTTPAAASETESPRSHHMVPPSADTSSYIRSHNIEAAGTTGQQTQYAQQGASLGPIMRLPQHGNLGSSGSNSLPAAPASTQPASGAVSLRGVHVPQPIRHSRNVRSRSPHKHPRDDANESSATTASRKRRVRNSNANRSGSDESAYTTADNDSAYLSDSSAQHEVAGANYGAYMD